MKIFLTTQIFNEAHRIIDWVEYHKKIGVHEILIFDDFSIDGTYQLLIEKYKNDPHVCIYQTDKSEINSIIYDNPNQYSGNEEIHQRIIRSYNTSINFIKNITYDGLKVCFFLDVDEYMVPCDVEKNISESLDGIDFTKSNRFLILSFDMKPPPSNKFEKNCPVYLQSNMRWSEETRFNNTGDFSMRTKIGVLIDSCESISSVHTGDIRSLSDWKGNNFELLSDKMMICDDTGGYNRLLCSKAQRLRIFHFRDQPQSEKWNLIYDELDDTIIKIMSK